MTVQIPGWLIYVFGGVVAAAAVPLSLLMLRRRAPAPAPVAPTAIREEVETEAITERAASAQAVIDAAAAGRVPREAAARLLNERAK